MTTYEATSIGQVVEASVRNVVFQLYEDARSPLLGDVVTIDVDDDGAGLGVEMREAALKRGVRVDERAPGFGLGLAIVRDIVDAYGGTIGLETSPVGGLRARLVVPRQE